MLPDATTLIELSLQTPEPVRAVEVCRVYDVVADAYRLRLVLFFDDFPTDLPKTVWCAGLLFRLRLYDGYRRLPEVQSPEVCVREPRPTAPYRSGCPTFAYGEVESYPGGCDG